jgi:hypothetical protein
MSPASLPRTFLVKGAIVFKLFLNDSNLMPLILSLVQPNAQIKKCRKRIFKILPTYEMRRMAVGGFHYGAWFRPFSFHNYPRNRKLCRSLETSHHPDWPALI